MNNGLAVPSLVKFDVVVGQLIDAGSKVPMSLRNSMLKLWLSSYSKVAMWMSLLQMYNISST
jgi:hypothetical protein